MMKNVDNISENKRLNAMRRLLFISFVILIIHCANNKFQFANGVDVRKTSFFLFAGFIFAYSLFDPYVTKLYFNTYGELHLWSALIIFFEGVAGSMIIGMIAMMYSDRYEDGEAKI